MSGSIKGEGFQTQLNHCYLLEKRSAQWIYCHRNYFHFLFHQFLQSRGFDKILSISWYSPAFKNITSIVKHFLGYYNVTRLWYSKLPPSPTPRPILWLFSGIFWTRISTNLFARAQIQVFVLAKHNECKEIMI